MTKRRQARRRSVRRLFHVAGRCRAAGIALTLGAAWCAAAGAVSGGEGAIERIAFGSCFKQGQGHAFWSPILEYGPDAMVFLGDNGYPDAEDPPDFDKAYGALMGHPDFRRLNERATVLATWDDHDYGKNDAGRANPHKRAAKRAFLKHWDIPADHPMRERGGVYRSRVFGPEARRVQIILLDTRWFRDAWKEKDAEAKDGWPGYAPDADPGKTMLGEKQWAWLERVLERPAEVRVVASSIQVAAEQHKWEKWANFPAERARLLELVDEASGLALYISGDRHRAEISRIPPGDHGRFDLEDPAMDVTSSSLNLPFGQSAVVDEPNRWRVGDADGMHGVANFGALTIDWSGRTPRLEATVRDMEGEVLEKARLP